MVPARHSVTSEAHAPHPSPIQEGCRCRACRSFSRAYLAHLLRADELLFYRLATLHNLTFLTDFMARIRAALAEGNFPRLVRELAAQAPTPTSLAGMQA